MLTCLTTWFAILSLNWLLGGPLSQGERSRGSHWPSFPGVPGAQEGAGLAVLFKFLTALLSGSMVPLYRGETEAGGGGTELLHRGVGCCAMPGLPSVVRRGSSQHGSLSCPHLFKTECHVHVPFAILSRSCPNQELESELTKFNNLQFITIFSYLKVIVLPLISTVIHFKITGVLTMTSAGILKFGVLTSTVES